jgi:hypothetical protein
VKILFKVLFLIAIAQNNAQPGLKGTVTDPSGGRIAGAIVQLRGSSGEQTQTTNATGEYVFANVKPGT